MIKIISPSSKDNHVASKGTNNRTSSSIPKQKNNVKSSQVTEKFPLDKINVTDKLNLIYTNENLKEFYKNLPELFRKLFKQHVPVFNEEVLTQDRITLIAIVTHPQILTMLYTKSCDMDKKALDGLGALVLRIYRLQTKILTICLLLKDNPSQILITKQHEIFQMLNSNTFLRLPSMLKSIPGQPPATFQSTFAAIVKKLIPIEFVLRELLHVVACKQYGPQYNNVGHTEAVTSIIEQYAPEGFYSNQKDLYYLMKSLRVLPCFTPEQHKQWRQYSIEIYDLINISSNYPEVDWNLLNFIQTQKINMPVNLFFAFRPNAQPVSKTTYSHFIDRATCLVGFLWLILFSNVHSSSEKAI